jgi:hypothetical protein
MCTPLRGPATVAPEQHAPGGFSSVCAISHQWGCGPWRPGRCQDWPEKQGRQLGLVIPENEDVLQNEGTCWPDPGRQGLKIINTRSGGQSVELASLP